VPAAANLIAMAFGGRFEETCAHMSGKARRR
jgi:hypothetical protein